MDGLYVTDLLDFDFVETEVFIDLYPRNSKYRDNVNIMKALNSQVESHSNLYFN